MKISVMLAILATITAPVLAAPQDLVQREEMALERYATAFKRIREEVATTQDLPKREVDKLAFKRMEEELGQSLSKRHFDGCDFCLATEGTGPVPGTTYSICCCQGCACYGGKHC
ncbi:unnamed protein product [Zymoseptoria tritici ST99CH_3D1]|uniref:Uncharacterized protein n=1 Tax=Zymoseptoria tritici (strain CBS 115943 / IPO323) TaxID=336722 RepID=F9X1F3_ZYMTI|nr:uncharacterized protein MYCGRDRAFT_102792 [Zymoseptoria tritici IPO323]EGP92063.1 hypothetical protein MYCGRDRAFT_102792 [Zymoseptoria tritici IPO323]SMR45042.1 unnamed protein product [Zymoseptoria tritici ST99CH_3D1]